MKTTAIPVLQLRLPSSSRLTTRLSDFFALMKPRVMLLAAFTALVPAFALRRRNFSQKYSFRATAPECRET
jgi:hypothetical protein